MRMDGSADSVRKSSNSSRGLNLSGVSNRNPISFRASSIRSSGTSEFTLGRTRRDLDAPRSCKDRQECDRKRECKDVSLRQWLDNPERVVSEPECLHIFRQIVEIVSLAHSQGIVVHNVRPSCFVMSSFNHVSFIESASSSDSGSDSFEDVSTQQTVEFKGYCSPFPHEIHQHKSHLGTESSPYSIDQSNTSQMISGSCLQSGSGNLMHVSACNVDQTEEKKNNFPMKQILRMETNWYTSPEELTGAPGSCASDIYRLGVMLFELYCTFSSAEEKGAIMSNLRHRVLPPQLLLKWPKEASFCLWLLHPQPTSRPKMSELLQSRFLNEPRDDIEERKVKIELKEKIEEQELSLEFLLLMQQRKQETADKLREMVSFISSDIDEITKMQAFSESKGGFQWEQNPLDSIKGPSLTENEDLGESRKRFRLGFENAEVSYGHYDNYQNSEAFIDKHEKTKSMSSRLKKNFKKLELAYFMTRRRVVKPTGKPYSRYLSLSSDGKGSISASEKSALNSSPFIEHYGESRTDGWINSFLEGLCKYLSFTDIKVKAELKQADLFNTPNLVCALGFDRDGEFFATAGVNKKIKVFEYETILNEDRDIHYPVVEMSSRSKLSSICWNGYIKSQIASSNFDGVVQVWDVTRNQVFTEMKEHQKRVWSVDYSVADPTMLASGSDDGSVKLWNINQGASVGTIRTKANICSVQFPSDSSSFLAFGSADHNIYYYDLRNMKMPLYTLVGHNKTVSYIKFIDSMNLVSASTDNTLKLWDLSMCTSRVLDCPVQSFTGHLNVKNFVGLSIFDGYIATGSETNEVFIYQKAFPMPALSFKFNTDSLSDDIVDDTGQFISSVCWRTQSSTLLAANSTGNIKLLEMV